jgi:uncharacterized radical SAM protein YgiQ
MTPGEMASRGWRELDVLLVTGDAYFDHPSHGAAVIGRVLEREGYRVGIAARPRWRSAEDFARLGRPRLFAGVTAGAVDSSVSNFTSSRARRRNDAYAPGGIGGGRPDQATLVYANRVREAFPGLPVILGGIEASLRRFAYFDAARDRIRRSLLVDSRADLLVYGPGEAAVVEIARRLAAGRDLEGVPGTARLLGAGGLSADPADIALPDFDRMERDRALLLEQARLLDIAARPGFSARVCQRYAEGTVVTYPSAVTTPAELDRVHALGFAREAHPLYREGIPALETVRWSVISHRGCPGGCSFCGLAAHQGRGVVSRSDDSIIEEVSTLSRMPGFRGTVTDIGGPTANAFGLGRRSPEACLSCARRSCLHPRICRHLDAGHDRLLALLERASGLPGVAHVFLASGLRHDLALRDGRFIDEIARLYTGGHLKVAPEHVARGVLLRMRKPALELFEAFEARFLEASRRAGKQQYLVPYFIAGFPGCTPEEADAVGRWLASRGQRLRQCQIFIPLAGTAAAAMAASGRDEAGAPLFLPDAGERKRQKAVMVGEVKGARRPRVASRRPARRTPR